MLRDTPMGDYAAGLLGAVVQLLDQGIDQHKPHDLSPDHALADMTEDIGRVAAMIAGTYMPNDSSLGDGWRVPDADADVIAEFARLYKVRKGDAVPDDAVSYYRPAYPQTDRDDLLLVVAVLDAYGTLVSPGKPHAAWTASIDLSRELWLDQREWREVDQMSDALIAGIMGRFELRKQPARKSKKAKSELAVSPAPATEIAAMMPPVEGDTVSKPNDAALKIVKEYGIAVRAARGGAVGQWPVAFILLDQGKEKYPDAKLPSGATWDKMRDATIKMIPADVREVVMRQITPAPVAVPVPVVAQAAPVAVPVPVVAQAAPEPQVLVIRHTVENGTHLEGTRKGDGVNKIMGKDGLKWSWWMRGKVWYVRNSKDGGADLVKVRQAEQTLRAHGYTVTVEIDNRDESGQEIAPRVSKAEQSRRAQAASYARSSLLWHLTNGNLPCANGCGVTGLTVQTATIADVDGMSVAMCQTCAPAPAPVAVPVPLPVVAQAAPEPVAVPVPEPLPVPVPEPLLVPVVAQAAPEPVAVPVPEPEFDLTSLLAAAAVDVPAPAPVAVPVVAQAAPEPVAVPVVESVQDPLAAIPSEVLVQELLRRLNGIVTSSAPVAPRRPASLPKVAAPKATAAPSIVAVPPVATMTLPTVPVVQAAPVVTAPVAGEAPVYPGDVLGEFLLDTGAGQKQTAKMFRSALFQHITSKMLRKSVPADQQLALSVYVRDGLFTVVAKVPSGVTVDTLALSDSVRVVAGMVEGVVIA